ncbi:thioredoxin [Diplocloster hominis]|uniref:thioredoxin n=1 Tax=Diplocloster hominis TaxID=3079010 RepID=UPI0031BB3118
MSAITITEENIAEKTKGSLPLLVDFWAPWCGYCRAIAPAVEQLAQDYQSRLTVGKINIDEQMKIAEKYQIMTIPTLILFQDGNAGQPLVAPKNRSQIETWLKDQGIQLN